MSTKIEDQYLTSGIQTFTKNMYEILSQQEGNIFFSPLSCHTVLSMAYQGSGASTEEAFSACLNVINKQTTSTEYKNLLQFFSKLQKVTMLMANKMYISNNISLMDDFRKIIQDNYLSDVEELDFGENQRAAQKINDWIETKTNNKIKNLIKSQDLNELTKLVLVNAIYFNSEWKIKFDKSKTTSGTFHLSETEEITVRKMFMKKHFLYKEDENIKAQILEIPYKNQEVSLVIILPEERQGIGGLERNIKQINFANVMEGSNNVEVHVYLPKFKIEQVIDLKNTLSKMGLQDAFNDKAEFPNISSYEKELHIDKIIQKAFLEINEDGSEAAVATGLQMKRKYASWSQEEQREIIFNVDHPFLFMCKVSGVCLFLGRVSNPITIQDYKPFVFPEDEVSDG